MTFLMLGSSRQEVKCEILKMTKISAKSVFRSDFPDGMYVLTNMVVKTKV